MFFSTDLLDVLPISTMIMKMTEQKRKNEESQANIFRVLVALFICAFVKPPSTAVKVRSLLSSAALLAGRLIMTSVGWRELLNSGRVDMVRRALLPEADEVEEQR